MSTTIPRTYKGVIAHYQSLPLEIQSYFDSLDSLIQDYIWPISIGYLFHRTELSNNMALYCSAVKLHHCDPRMADLAIDNTKITRFTFKGYIQTLLNVKFPQPIWKYLEDAALIRNKVVHGKKVTELENRAATTYLLHYAEQFNTFINRNAGFKPFSPDLRGFTGRAKSHDESTSKWMLKGMGFTIA